MQYNIHPIIVHFPIAFLFLYSIIKILPLEKWLPRVAWKDIERVLLLFGVLGAFAALSTGEIAEDLVRPDEKLVEAHAFFANASTWFYGLLLAGEILSILNISLIYKLRMPRVEKLSLFIAKILTHKNLSKVMAVLGLLAITLTGMLGGVMVYGLSADPLAGIVLKILGITL